MDNIAYIYTLCTDLVNQDSNRALTHKDSLDLRNQKIASQVPLELPRTRLEQLRVCHKPIKQTNTYILKYKDNNYGQFMAPNEASRLPRIKYFLWHIIFVLLHFKFSLCYYYS